MKARVAATGVRRGAARASTRGRMADRTRASEQQLVGGQNFVLFLFANVELQNTFP
jgi:hypothetical protein